MRESIRHAVGRRARRYVALAIVGWLTFVAAIFLPAIPLVVMALAFCAVIAGLLGLILGLRCPRCRGRLPQIGLAEVWRASRMVVPQHCPHCSVALDGPC
jgi:hypothetical protein